jgi:DNA-binding IclR family transcriptional regulator
MTTPMVFGESTNALPATDARRDAVRAALIARGGSATCAELARDTGLHSSTVSVALHRMIARGEVERVGLGRTPTFRLRPGGATP